VRLAFELHDPSGELAYIGSFQIFCATRCGAMQLMHSFSLTFQRRASE
jgi:hypothetical protein